MPLVLSSRPHLVLRRLSKEDLHGLADVLPQALADAGDWFAEDPCA